MCWKKPLGLTCVMVLGILPALDLAKAADWEERLSKTFTTCVDKANGVTGDTIQCMGAETTRQDDLLNAAYKRAMATLPADQKDKMRQAQRTWITFRDQNCATLMGSETGSMARVEANTCMLRMTAERAKELEDLTAN